MNVNLRTAGASPAESGQNKGVSGRPKPRLSAPGPTQTAHAAAVPSRRVAGSLQHARPPAVPGPRSMLAAPSGRAKQGFGSSGGGGDGGGNSSGGNGMRAPGGEDFVTLQDVDEEELAEGAGRPVSAAASKYSPTATGSAKRGPAPPTDMFSPQRVRGARRGAAAPRSGDPSPRSSEGEGHAGSGDAFAFVRGGPVPAIPAITIRDGHVTVILCHVLRPGQRYHAASSVPVDMRGRPTPPGVPPARFAACTSVLATSPSSGGGGVPPNIFCSVAERADRPLRAGESATAVARALLRAVLSGDAEAADQFGAKRAVSAAMQQLPAAAGGDETEPGRGVRDFAEGVSKAVAAGSAVSSGPVVSGTKGSAVSASRPSGQSTSSPPMSAEVEADFAPADGAHARPTPTLPGPRSRAGSRVSAGADRRQQDSPPSSQEQQSATQASAASLSAWAGEATATKTATTAATAEDDGGESSENESEVSVIDVAQATHVGSTAIADAVRKSATGAAPGLIVQGEAALVLQCGWRSWVARQELMGRAIAVAQREGTMIPLPRTVPGASGWYKHGITTSVVFYFSVRHICSPAAQDAADEAEKAVDTQWTQLVGPMLEEDWEDVWAKARRGRSLVAVGLTKPGKSGLYMDAATKVHRFAVTKDGKWEQEPLHKMMPPK